MLFGEPSVQFFPLSVDFRIPGPSVTAQTVVVPAQTTFRALLAPAPKFAEVHVVPPFSVYRATPLWPTATPVEVLRKAMLIRGVITPLVCEAQEFPPSVV